jgi:hypothetical protein
VPDYDYILDCREIKRVIYRSLDKNQISLSRLCSKLGISCSQVQTWLHNNGEKGKDITQYNIGVLLKELGYTLKIAVVEGVSYVPREDILKLSALTKTIDFTEDRRVLEFHANESTYNRIISGEQNEVYLKFNTKNNEKVKGCKYVDVYSRNDKIDTIRLLITRSTTGRGKRDWCEIKTKYVYVIEFEPYGTID